MRKRFGIMLITAVVTVTFGLAACNDKSENTSLKAEKEVTVADRSKLEGRDEEAMKLAQDYMDQKYGKGNFKISESHLEPRNNQLVFTGKSPYFQIYAEDVTKKYSDSGLEIVFVYPKNSDGEIKLYVESDTCYGYFIWDRMAEYMREKLKAGGIKKAFVRFRGMGASYPADYSIDADAETLLKKYNASEGQFSPFSYIIEIPQSSFKSKEQTVKDFSKVKADIEKLGADLEITVRVISDKDFKNIKKDDGGCTTIHCTEQFNIMDHISADKIQKEKK